MNKFLVISFFTLFFFGCSVVPKLGLDKWLPYKRPMVKVEPAMGIHYSEAIKAYNAGKWGVAAKLFEKNADSLGVGKAQIDSFYFAGESNMMLGNFEKAETFFRQAHLAARLKFPRTEALALYRKSYAQEEQNKDLEALASLQDVFKRRSLLPNEVSKAELPSRIAGIYARLGKLKVASKYYEEAENGLQSLKSNLRGNYPDWYTKTLFYMGATSLGALSADEYEAQLKPLRSSQKYLLQAVENQNGNWSIQAYEQILRSYNNLYRVIRSLPYEDIKDRERAKKVRRDRQSDMVIQAKLLLNELRLLRLPRGDSQLSSKLFSELSGIEEKLDLLLYKPGDESELTPASKSRQRPLKTISPDDSLENDKSKLDPNL